VDIGGRSEDAGGAGRRGPLVAAGIVAIFVAAVAGIFYYEEFYLPGQGAAADARAHAVAAASGKEADERVDRCRTDYSHKDYAAAATSCREAASSGDPVSQRYLGIMCHSGLGMPRNDADALTWLTKAAAQDDPQAQVILGAMYRDGDGVKRDYAQARSWYHKAAARGNADAQFNLGVMYFDGDGVERSYSDAMSWFRMAAVQGSPDAQKMLLEVERRASEPADMTPQAGAGYFTIGSSKMQVLALQGTPTSMQTLVYPRGSERWSYDRCSVTFDEFGRVKDYSSDCGKLRIALGPIQYFTIGSSRAQVLAIQGTPTSVQTGYPRGTERWSYDGCSVGFDESGRVKDYSNMCGQLHIKLDLIHKTHEEPPVTVDRSSTNPDDSDGDDNSDGGNGQDQ
jgi:hypothetical protein